MTSRNCRSSRRPRPNQTSKQPLHQPSNRNNHRHPKTNLDCHLQPCHLQLATCNPATLHPPPSTSHRPPATRWLAVAIAIAALLGAIFWSLAYVNGVYNTSHPWIKASNWIYANIPDGSTIGWEQWDNSLPYDLPEPNSSRGRYQFTDWGPFEEDTPEKYERLKEFLRRSDAIALSSNRIYGAVDNLPERYPLTNRYYQLLFDGKLGFELALEQANHPNLLGIDINDEKADESFTLYDHARVLVFRKGARPERRGVRRIAGRLMAGRQAVGRWQAASHSTAVVGVRAGRGQRIGAQAGAGAG